MNALSGGKPPPLPAGLRMGVICRVLEVWSQPVVIGTVVEFVRQSTARLKTDFTRPTRASSCTPCAAPMSSRLVLYPCESRGV